MDYLNQLGPLVLASRLKNLSDKLMQGVSRIYREMHIDFEPRWFPVTYYLYHIGPAQVTHLAEALKQTHPAILQVTNMMKKKGLVKLRKDENDQRKTIVLLTSEGLEMAKNLEETWQVISAASERLLRENFVDILENIELLEDALEQEDIYSRIRREYVTRHLNDLQIIGWKPALDNEFREINLQWLKDTVGVTPYDEQFLNDPQREVIDKGGQIYFALAGREVVGTMTLLPLDQLHVELTKLSVVKLYRRMGIGRRLTQFALDASRERGYQSMLLLTHPILKEAIWLYEEMGFVQTEPSPLLQDFSGRCSLTMEIQLTQ